MKITREGIMPVQKHNYKHMMRNIPPNNRTMVLGLLVREGQLTLQTIKKVVWGRRPIIKLEWVNENITAMLFRHSVLNLGHVSEIFPRRGLIKLALKKINHSVSTANKDK